jgi:hypothetical protein
MTSSIRGWFCTKAAQAGVTIQLMRASGHNRRSRGSTGSACTISPTALGLMIKTCWGAKANIAKFQALLFV